MPPVKGVGEPGAGEPHARFDGGALETDAEINGYGTWAPGQETPGMSARSLPIEVHRASALPDEARPLSTGPDEQSRLEAHVEWMSSTSG